VMILSFHFNDLQKAKLMIKTMRSDIWAGGVGIAVPIRQLYTGLVYLGLARQTKKRKYQRRAKKAMKQLLVWSKQGAVNCLYMHQLLVAEELSLSNARLDEVGAAYDDAIAEVEKLGLQHHTALANELAGMFLVSRSQVGTAAPYLLTAIKLYTEWGAVTKVQELQSRCPDAVFKCSQGNIQKYFANKRLVH